MNERPSFPLEPRIYAIQINENPGSDTVFPRLATLPLSMRICATLSLMLPSTYWESQSTGRVGGWA